MRSSDVSGCRPGVAIVDEFALGRNGARRPDAGGRELPPAPAGTASAAALAAIFRHHPIRRPAARRLAAARAGRRCLLAARPLALVLLALALLALALPLAGGLAGPAAAQDAVEVPRNWAVTPSGISTGGKFRLLFVTSSKRNARPTNIADYNRFVQGRAAAGHTEIRPFSSKFKVVGSTSSVDARDNTATTYTSSDKGVQIWWLRGGKAADDYEDFYDGSWDTKNFSAGRNESGGSFSGSAQIFSGSNNNGTASGDPLGGTSGSGVSFFEMQNPGTLYGSGALLGSSTASSFLALSPVFQVSDSVKGFSVSIASTPAKASAGYGAGETIRVRVDFGEAVTVTGAPYVVLDVGGQARRAAYESGTGTRHLVFGYRVARGETDTDGVSLCSDTTRDAGCGQITLDGGSVVAQSDSTAVGRDLPDLGNQSGHKVDAVAGAKGASISSTPLHADPGYSVGETVRVRVDFGEAVTVTGASYVVLDVGGTARRASYESGTGTRYLEFAYRVARGETDTNGVSLCADTMKDAGCGRITLAGGTIVAQSDSTAVERDLPALGNQSGHKVDGTAPRVRGVSIASTPDDAAAGYAADETIQVAVDFGEAMTVTGSPYLVLDMAGAPRRAAYESGSGTRFLVFAYTVVAADFDSDGVSLCSSRALDAGCGRIAPAGGSIRAASDSVAADLGLPELDARSGHKVDGQPDFTAPPGTVPMADPGAAVVPPGWSLIPSGLGSGRYFRLLFVSSTGRDATSSDINDYNNHVIANAGAGHTAIRAFKDGFRVIASTEAVDARDNAGLTGAGVPVYWLNGAEVAGNYADLLDGSWDSEAWTTEAGGTASSSSRTVWTGSTNAGVERFVGSSSKALGSRDPPATAALGELNKGSRTPLAGGFHLRTESNRLYGMSQLLRARPRFASLRLASTPRSGGTYRAGETVAAEWTFTEPVAVRGVPGLAFSMKGTDEAPGAGLRSMRYVSGSGTATLRFAYVVQRGDFTGGGAVPLSISSAAGESPIALDGAAIRAVADNVDADLAADASDGFPFSSPAEHRVGARPPAATGASISSTPASGTTYGAGETITLSLAMSEAVLVTGRPYVWLDVGGARRRADYAGPIGSATDAMAFSYTVRTGDFDADGVALCPFGTACGSIVPNGGTIRAVADEFAAVLRLPSLTARAGHRVDGMPVAVTAMPGACPGEVKVPSDWALKPSGIGVGGKFRLLFVTSTTRDANAQNIADYNSFVQARAAAGHSAIQAYSAGFRVLGSSRSATVTVHARDNTCTRSTDTDAAVYWLGGVRVANNYADLYDGSWDDTRNPKSEAGRTGKNFVWTGTGNDGTEAEFIGSGGIRFGRALGGRGTLVAGAELDKRGGEAMLFEWSRTPGHQYSLYGLSPVFVVKEAQTTASALSIISTPAIGDTYRLGEVIEFEVTYSEAVDVRGTPQLALVMRDGSGNAASEFAARYVSGTGTTKLVFAYTVAAGDRAAGGIATGATPLQLNGATITAVSDGFVAASALTASDYIQTSGSRSQVDGSLGLTGGVCERTPQVRDAIVAAVSAASDCSLVTEAHLAAIAGARTVAALTSVRAGDFAGLSKITGLVLRGSGIATLPAGLFDGLSSVTGLTVQTGLTRLEKDIFRGLGKVAALDLSNNQLAAGSLADGVFEPLEAVIGLALSGNPGADSFKPTADAGPGGALSAGQTVTLGGPRTSGGPWGSNATYAWTQTDGEGTTASTVTLSAADAAQPAFSVPALAAETVVNLGLTVTGRGGSYNSGSSTAAFTIRALAPTGVAPVSKPIADSTYNRDETIEFAVTFGDRVVVHTSLGTPRLGFGIGVGTSGSAARLAEYIRGSGTRRLVFAYTVAQADTDSDGIAVAADSLTLAGGAIVSVHGTPAILDHVALSTQSGHKVNGTPPGLTGGICGRTAQVRDKLVDLVRTAQSDTALTCATVTAHLGALSGTLDLGDQSIAVLKRGDFADLGRITQVQLNANDLTALPEGVFDGLDNTLTLLGLDGNRLQTIAPGAFDRLTGVSLLFLNDNQLSSLPPRLFEKLTNLAEPRLDHNPGSARFKPIARAGSAGGIEVASGGTVTLGVEGAENGFDDPWGDNVTWAWTRTAGTGGTLTGATTARPVFTAPTADGTLTFTLTVTGKGGVTATSRVSVRVAAGPKVTGVAFASSPAASGGYGLGEHIDVALRFDRPVTVDTTGGTPSVALTVGTARKSAAWRGGSGSRALVFRYTAKSTDTDTDGVDLVADSLALNGGTILGVSDGGAAAPGHEALAGRDGPTGAGRNPGGGRRSLRPLARGRGGDPGKGAGKQPVRRRLHAGKPDAPRGHRGDARRVGAGGGARPHDGAQGRRTTSPVWRA